MVLPASMGALKQTDSHAYMAVRRASYGSFIARASSQSRLNGERDRETTLCLLTSNLVHKNRMKNEFLLHLGGAFLQIVQQDQIAIYIVNNTAVLFTM